MGVELAKGRGRASEVVWRAYAIGTLLGVLLGATALDHRVDVNERQVQGQDRVVAGLDEHLRLIERDLATATGKMTDLREWVDGFAASCLAVEWCKEVAK